MDSMQTQRDQKACSFVHASLVSPCEELRRKGEGWVGGLITIISEQSDYPGAREYQDTYFFF